MPSLSRAFASAPERWKIRLSLASTQRFVRHTDHYLLRSTQNTLCAVAIMIPYFQLWMEWWPRIPPRPPFGSHPPGPHLLRVGPLPLWYSNFEEPTARMHSTGGNETSAVRGRIMLVVPFTPPPGYKWIIVKEYFDMQSNTVIRACDSHRNSFCLLVAVGSAIA